MLAELNQATSLDKNIEMTKSHLLKSSLVKEGVYVAALAVWYGAMHAAML